MKTARSSAVADARAAAEKSAAKPALVKKQNRAAVLTLLPMYAFTLIFVVLPLVYVVILSFLQRDATWGVTAEFTLDNYAKIFDPTYLKTFWESIKLAFSTTVLTFLIGYPFAYFMSRLRERSRGLLMLAVIVPFWTNALVRIYGWMTLLRSNGPLDALLMSLGLTNEPLKILYSYPAVLIGMVYALLPFMILPVYTSAEKLDWSLVEAARDLGASRFTAFRTITLKETLPGIMSGCVLTFVPCVGLFFISDLLGGGKIMLVGNLIKDQLLVARNWPFGAALSVVMMIMTYTFIWLYRKLTHSSDLEGF